MFQAEQNQQSHIDELYAKYDFEVDQLPDDEVDLDDLEDDELQEIDFTKEKLIEFNNVFTKIREFLKKLEAHNQCISKHKRRITTDLYSLWTALALDSELIQMDHQKIAGKYDAFMTDVSDAFQLIKEDKAIDGLDGDVQSYFNNSTGAATEVDLRKKRHTALTSYLKK